MKDLFPFKRQGPFGGPGGAAFSMVCDGLPDTLYFRCSDRIHAVQLSYSGRDNKVDSTEKAGGSGGVLHHFRLMRGERITHISLAASLFVEAVIIDTDNGRQARFGNEAGIINHICVVPEDQRFTGFFGRGSHHIDALGIICMPEPEERGSPFDFIPGLA